MNIPHSDTLVFFGATGDLAFKKIFPALQAMVKRGTLNVPVIGVARGDWSLDRLKARARDSLEKHGGVDPAAFEKLCGLLRYAGGDYNDPAMYKALVANSVRPSNRPTTLPYRPRRLALSWSNCPRRNARATLGSSLRSLLVATFPLHRR